MRIACNIHINIFSMKCSEFTVIMLLFIIRRLYSIGSHLFNFSHIIHKKKLTMTHEFINTFNIFFLSLVKVSYIRVLRVYGQCKFYYIYIIKLVIVTNRFEIMKKIFNLLHFVVFLNRCNRIIYSVFNDMTIEIIIK